MERNSATFSQTIKKNTEHNHKLKSELKSQLHFLLEM